MADLQRDLRRIKGPGLRYVIATYADLALERPVSDVALTRMLKWSLGEDCLEDAENFGVTREEAKTRSGKVLLLDIIISTRHGDPRKAADIGARAVLDNLRDGNYG